MNKIYDYIIVGSGPSGLVLAWYLSEKNKTVLLVDSAPNIGGCHRVLRVDDLLTEHGPRVYSDVYLNFINFLKSMNLDFYDLFTPYEFDISNIGDRTKNSFHLSEFSSFVYSFIRIIFNENYGKDISMKDFMNSNSFSNESKEYIDRLCRLTDGAETSRYTLFQFLQLVNNQVLYKLYQPKLPNDVGLFKIIELKLKETNFVTILLNSEVVSLTSGSNKNVISSIIIKDNLTSQTNTYIGTNYILAIPPKPLHKILLNSSTIENAFGTNEYISKWSQDNSYFDYIPITLHWKEKIKLEKIWGFPASDWGLAFIILSNYMKFDQLTDYKTVISTCITFTDRKSSVTNKTADESTKEEIDKEVLRQLRESYPDIPNPDRMITSPQVYYDNIQKKWINIDTAFVTTINSKQYLPFKSEKYFNLYNCGAQNGMSNYHFTSMETAVVNALNLFNELVGENGSSIKINNDYKKITNYIHIGLIIIIVILFYYYYSYKIKKYIV